MSNYERGTEARSKSTDRPGATRVDDRPGVDEPTGHREPAVVAYAGQTGATRRDRVRWGPVWAGVVVALGSFMLFQLALVAVGAMEIVNPGTTDAVLSAAAAGLAFLIGGFVTGASAMWRGLDDGLLHGVVLWAIALVALLAFAGFGSGMALGALDPTETFEDIALVEAADPGATGTEVTVDDVQEAAGWALLALVVALVATSVGAVLGAKTWPNKDEIDLRDDTREASSRSIRR